jgi:hypothetical protein
MNKSDPIASGERLQSGKRSAPIAPPNPWLMLLFVAGIALFYLYVHVISHGERLLTGWLEDVPVYADAITSFSSGQDPYLQFHGPLQFVYSPIFLFGGRFLAHLLPPHAGRFLFIFVYLVSILGMPPLLARYYLREVWLTPVFALVIWFGEPRFTGILALYSGNVAPVVYFACLVAALPGIRKNLWTYFYAAVLLAGAIKITFVVLLLLPVLVGRRQWLWSVLCGLSVIGIHLLEKVLTPFWYEAYKTALHAQLWGQGRCGYGIFGLAATIELSLRHTFGAPTYAIHLLFCAILFGTLLVLQKRGADQIDSTLWMALMLISIILLNPRILHYDVYIGVFASIVALAVLLQTRHLLLMLVLLFIPSLIFPRVMHHPLLYGLSETGLMVITFVLVAWKLWRMSIDMHAIEAELQASLPHSS